MKLANRILMLAVASILPGIGAAAYTEFALRAERREEINQLAMRNTRQAAAFVEQVLVSIRTTLTAAKTARQILESDQCTAYLAGLKDSLAFIGSLGVIESNGMLRCSSSSVNPINLSDRLYFIEARKTKSFVVGEYLRGLLTQTPQLMTAMPVSDAEEAPAVVYASLNLSWLQKEIESLDIPFGAAVTLADRNGTIIARKPQPERFAGTQIPAPFNRLVTAPSDGVLELMSQDGTRRVVAYSPVESRPKGVYVSSGLSNEEAYRAIDRSRVFTLGVTTASFVFALLLAGVLGRYFIEKPLNAITGTMNRWRGGDSAARTLASPAEGEFGQIGASLDILLNELDRRLHEREILSREMAHRVKNTLTIVQAIAGQTLRGAGGLGEFNMRLGALARAYDVLLDGKGRASSISKVVRAAIEPYQPAGRAQITFEGDDRQIDARAALGLTLVLNELCTNALKHGALSVPEGQVRVSCSVGEDDQVSLVWSESGGPPVPQTPRAAGFGSVLIRSAFPQEYKARVALAYQPSGVTCELTFSNGASR